MKATELAKKYNEFQSHVGVSNNNVDETISTLFADNFRKIVNGEILVKNRSELQLQLESIKIMGGSWVIHVKDVAGLEDPNRCLIRYHLVSEKLGVFDVLATLRASNSRIEEVDEIYYIVNK
jgi:hypothetical protein